MTGTADGIGVLDNLVLRDAHPQCLLQG